jgi:plasmid replication initiation protein
MKNKAYLITQQRHRTRAAWEEYKAKRREEKRIHRSKKRAYDKMCLERPEDLRDRKETRKFYEAVKLTRKDFKPRAIACKHKDGTVINDKAKILSRWAEHFHMLLN